MGLEKDKEDQNEYYLSYPKPPILDVNWENCRNNVTEQTSHSKFGKLGDIRALFRLFELFLDYALVNQIVGYSKLCAHREKDGTSFEITNESMNHYAYSQVYDGNINKSLE